MLRQTIRQCMMALALFGLSISLYAQQSALKDHDTKQPFDVQADQLQADNKAGRARFSGNVEVRQGAMTLKSETLLIFYLVGSDAADPQIGRLDATGGVSLASATETVQANWGIYDVEKRLITFGGDVTLKQGDNLLSGKRLELDLVSGVMRLDGDVAAGGRVQGSFTPPSASE